MRVNEKSRYGTSAIREQPEVGGARLVLEWYCRKRVDVIQIQEDFISEGINDHNAAWPRYIAHNEARRDMALINQSLAGTVSSLSSKTWGVAVPVSVPLSAL